LLFLLQKLLKNICKNVAIKIFRKKNIQKLLVTVY